MTEMAMPTSWDRVEVGAFLGEPYTIETGYGHDANGLRCQWWRYVIEMVREGGRYVSTPFTSILDCRRGAMNACERRAFGDLAVRRSNTGEWTTVALPTEPPPWMRALADELAAFDPTKGAFDHYDAAVARTMATAPGDTSALAHWALGLAGEAGEVCEPIKKHAFNGRDLDRDALAAELGDVLWYLSALAQSIGSSLSEVAARNVAKLEARYPDGYVPGGGKR